MIVRRPIFRFDQAIHKRHLQNLEDSQDHKTLLSMLLLSLFFDQAFPDTAP